MAQMVKTAMKEGRGMDVFVKMAFTTILSVKNIKMDISIVKATKERIEKLVSMARRAKGMAVSVSRAASFMARTTKVGAIPKKERRTRFLIAWPVVIFVLILTWQATRAAMNKDESTVTPSMLS